MTLFCLVSPSSYHIGRQRVAREVFDVLVLRIDDLGELPPVDHFLINPHVYHRVEAVGGLHVAPDYFGDGGAPGARGE